MATLRTAIARKIARIRLDAATAESDRVDQLYLDGSMSEGQWAWAIGQLDRERFDMLDTVVRLGGCVSLGEACYWLLCW